MNLIQIQEHLKDLPTDVVKAYANAQNPEVPPYMALGELERRSRAEKRKTEMPTQSVKDKLEAEVGAPRAMPQGMPQGVVQMPQQAPQGIAQLAQGIPQGMPQELPAMAGGGVAELPVRDDMFNYAPGGIVAFGGGGEADEETAGEAEARANMETQGPPVSAMPQAGVASLTGPATAALAKAIRGDTDEPMPKDPESIRQAILEKNPELARLVSVIPGSALSALSAKLDEQNKASKAQFQENQKRMGLSALGDALIAAGEATRGQKGLGAAFAGFGKSYSNYTAEDIKRQQAQQALERQQMIEIGKLDADIETLRQAYAKAQIEGRVADAIAYQKALADRIAKRESLAVTASKDALTAANTEMQTKGTLAHYKKLEENEALKLKEMISHNATQADIERQRLKYQAANYASEAAHRKFMEKIAEETKPSAEDIVLNTIKRNLNNNKQYQSFLERQKDTVVGSDAFNELQGYIEDIESREYKKHHLSPPEKLVFPKTKEPPAEEGSWKAAVNASKASPDVKKFTEDPYGTGENDKKGVASLPFSKPNVMYAVNPTTGQRIMSSDNGETWTPLGGRR